MPKIFFVSIQQTQTGYIQIFKYFDVRPNVIFAGLHSCCIDGVKQSKIIKSIYYSDKNKSNDIWLIYFLFFVEWENIFNKNNGRNNDNVGYLRVLDSMKLLKTSDNEHRETKSVKSNENTVDINGYNNNNNIHTATLQGRM